jgi:hypothetical protein
MDKPAHKKITDIGDFAIWETPSGRFEIYSPTSLLASTGTIERALEYARAKVREAGPPDPLTALKAVVATAPRLSHSPFTDAIEAAKAAIARAEGRS